MNEEVLKTRPHWKVDPEYQKFHNRLYDEFWTFEETCAIVQFDKFVFKENKEEILKTMKTEWTKYATKWNAQENIDSMDKIKSFVAISYLFIVIPFQKLDDVGKYFTENEANMINIVYFRESNCQYLPFENLEELFASGPVFPPAYAEWLEQKCNSACWWIGYSVYEKINGLESVVISPKAKLKK